ncbi:Integral membrane protein TmpA [Zostera marina]|uniref:Integral membrane protein TmpA n=1 Tax=Zostera marina TaxID=29655 RepID=A0A0K9PLE4_ZOSMR|nr:Integral membrane protein TmpA [Zostera marina]
MKDRQNVVAVRSSSCRDVSFEVRSAIKSHPRRYNSVHGFEFIGEQFERAQSRLFGSSHFCDINVDYDEEEGYLEEEIYPEASSMTLTTAAATTNSGGGDKKKRLAVILDHQSIFTVYKLLFLVSFVVNITALTLAVFGRFSYARRNATVIAVGNILGLVLCRSEVFLRCVYWLAVRVLGRNWVPMILKTTTTSLLQSIGGIHSGCGLSSIAWQTYALVQTERTPIDIPTVGWTILCLLTLSSLSANPIIRHLYHDAFENIHRFAGWAALGLLWVFVVITTEDDLANLVRREIFWLTVAITFFIIFPWTTVRKVPVEVTSPSPHASIIKFPGGLIPGLFGRIARSPLKDWHAFGTISDGKDTHKMLIGAVGDFTQNLITNPPTHLWVRQTRFAGLTYLLNMYKRVVVIATGSGLCVYLSFFLQPSAADVHLVWVTKDVEKNVGGEIKAMLDSFPKEKVVVYDTAVSGRPDLATITVDAARRWMADMVVVTSNPQGTAEAVSASKAAGFNAFGPIWDS